MPVAVLSHRQDPVLQTEVYLVTVDHNGRSWAVEKRFREFQAFAKTVAESIPFKAFTTRQPTKRAPLLDTFIKQIEQCGSEDDVQALVGFLSEGARVDVEQDSNTEELTDNEVLQIVNQ